MSKRLSTKPFFNNSDLTLKRTKALVQDGLKNTDYGEFFHQIKEGESIGKSMGEFSGISSGSRSEGFGFRTGKGATTGYVYSDHFNEQSLSSAIKQARQAINLHGDGERTDRVAQFGRHAQPLYPHAHSMHGMSVEDKLNAINTLESHIMGLDPNIRNVSIGYNAAMDLRHIITADGKSLVDHKPMSGLSVNIQLANDKGETQSGAFLHSSRDGCSALFNEAILHEKADKALERARILHDATFAPPGRMDVVLAPGWPAVILHEAVGHGLEGDFNRKGVSVYSGKLDQRIASAGVTIIDQGNMPGERGSLYFDDEGTPSQQNILVEDGILRGYMQDRKNAFLMGAALTGNGRRETFRHMPMPRMTNTYFGNGTHDPADIIANVKDGLYVAAMGGGQVDITSGRFNMNVTLGYRIRNGILCEPIKGAAVIGEGHDIINKIAMVGNDLEIEKHAGACGKSGQSVAVSCGQPTILVKDLTVGGMG